MQCGTFIHSLSSSWPAERDKPCRENVSSPHLWCTPQQKLPWSPCWRDHLVKIRSQIVQKLTSYNFNIGNVFYKTVNNMEDTKESYWTFHPSFTGTNTGIHHMNNRKLRCKLQNRIRFCGDVCTITWSLTDCILLFVRLVSDRVTLSNLVHVFNGSHECNTCLVSYFRPWVFSSLGRNTSLNISDHGKRGNSSK